jgi:Xaa-Pro aminopeptidase
LSDLLLYGDTESSPALRHEVPVAIGDAFLYAEVDGRVYVQSSPLERDGLARARPDAELIDIADLGFAELRESGLGRDEVLLELVRRAAARTGVRRAIVDFAFPVGLADRLRADGIELTVDDPAVKARRRGKTPGEMDGIRRAQAAAEAAMATAAALLRRARPVDGRLQLEGRDLLAETVRAAMRDASWRRGALLPNGVIVASVHQGFGHEPGSGPLPAGLPIQVDVWPQDPGTSCWADMTRTFVAGGEPGEEVCRQERLVRQALDAARDAVRPGVTGRELHALVCEIFEEAGYRTQRTGPGEDPQEGFQFALGHGVGLRVHEDPGLGPSGRDPLVAGDVLALEPGLWQRDVGGVRFEDLILVTEDGCQTLTDFPYDLAP